MIRALISNSLATRSQNPPGQFFLLGYTPLMKKLLIVLTFVGSIVATHHFSSERAFRKGVIRGYLAGKYDGHWSGVFSCPCWAREGNVCSLCDIKISK